MKAAAFRVFQRFQKSRALMAVGLVSLPLALGACIPAIFGAGTATGVAVAQERSVGGAIDDGAIQVALQGKLFDRSGGLFVKVGIEVDEGRVLLTGVVPKPNDRIDAARIAWSVKGVKEVLNEIQVTDKSGLISYTKDVWITTKLRSKIIRDDKIFGINYTIETVNTVVYLIGIAQGADELNRVTEHARNIGGVTEVISHVRYKDDPRRTWSRRAKACCS